METSIEALVETLREARRLKGLSQRDLSKKAGLTQAHLSRIESGAIDLKLSTLLELARLLDLEPTLVPRTAISAVNAVMREADANREVRVARGAINILQQFGRIIRGESPDNPLGERLAVLSREFLAFEPLLQSSADLAELEDISQEVQSLGLSANGDWSVLRKSIDRLASLRNRLIHQRADTQRPAYSLDEED